MLTEIDPHLVAEYRRIRAKRPELDAKTCLSIARDLRKYRNLPESWEQDGFTITVSSDYYEDGDTSYFGRFAYRWSDLKTNEGEDDRAIDRWARDYGQRHGAVDSSFFEDPHAFVSRHDARYVVPEADYRTERQAFLDYKYGKREADERARKLIQWQVEALESYCERWWYINVDVKVSKNGITLGRASIGGVETGLGEIEDPIRMIADEHGLVDEALDEARATLESLCTHRIAATV